MPFNITQTLLCAARQTYEIKPTGKVGDYKGPSGPYPALTESACVTYAAPPKGFLAGAHKIDGAMVAVTAEGVLVALRGTLPPETAGDGPLQALAVIADWAKNAHVRLISTQGYSLKFPGLVHQGYYDAFRNLWVGPKMLAETVRDLLVLHPDKKRVLVTGHSKGGAVAGLVAWQICEMLKATPVAFAQHKVLVHTFAAPRVGDVTFAAKYNAEPRIEHHRHEYDDDIAPHFPIATADLEQYGVAPITAMALSSLDPNGYGQLGTLHYYGEDGAVVANPSYQARLGEIAARLRPNRILKPGGAQFVFRCHKIDRPVGYVAYGGCAYP